jgi:hypothetical protein
MKVRMKRPMAALAMLVSAAGCGLVPTTIPAGEWVGRGTYVDYEAVLTQENPAATTQRAKDGSYETTLRITSTRAFGREAWIVAIDSKRGKLFNIPGEETKGEVALVKLQALGNEAALYAVLDKETLDSQQGMSPQTSLPADTVASAISLQTPAGLVLHVDYGIRSLGFTDTFHFRPGGRVSKTGSISSWNKNGTEDKLMTVWWVEELHPGRW